MKTFMMTMTKTMMTTSHDSHATELVGAKYDDNDTSGELDDFLDVLDV